ncbi:bifunctional glutamate--cysteine ligase GshA/glutathione synthetase GshB [Vagococcus coleopterorum]|uniref:Glutathione biosynthesis bifunctional protein GshAB n=2 Tax=Vagococcus coleopterorum TaxID=2714946 RepID=A0A6G8APX4_9ENTE|nr:bifunctional glutamate--cysteine ligase GshA/glutathione synthetase GshB [Vagococcus coleopterorum]
MQEKLSEIQFSSLFKGAKIGIEKESQRVNLDGELAKTAHPNIFGNRTFHPTIQTDFSETQVEIITPVTTSAEEVMSYLAGLHEVVRRSLPEGEMLWPLSMPPVLPQDEKDIQIAKLDNPKDVAYREHLAKVYGKRKQMVSGIHYNFEFDPILVKRLFADQSEISDYREFRTELYLKVARNYLRYRWLITYLMGAAPQSERGYFSDCGKNAPDMPVRSIRNSNFGYTNDESVFVSYRSIKDYAESIQRLVANGAISEEKEFYSAVRLRGGKTVAEIAEKGVGYIEIRNIDNNPFAPYGITEEQVELLHYFLMYMLWLDNEDCDADELLHKGEALNNQVALENPLTQTSQKAEGLELLAGWLGMAKAIGANETVLTAIEKYQSLMAKPEETLAGQMLTHYNSGLTQCDMAVELGNTYQAQAWEKSYQLAGFDDMELSTQMMIFDSFQKGINVEILDRRDQFLKLSYQDHIEYVKNANMTSLDNYVVPLMMENKTVTKKVLAEAGFSVPGGKEYGDVESANADYGYFVDRGIVVKPKSTNYGLGISIFKDGASEAAYQEAVELAFREDSDILVEDFIEGTEYRFFVIDGQTEAITLRIPANVKGDGTATIRELVAEKNKNPLRGQQYRAPLQKIQTGDLEALMLKEQGYDFDTVLAQDEIVYLRENSNVSTGGDSIDLTEEMPQCYKDIAAQAVVALGAEVSGIDLIIPDINVPADKNDYQAYGIIEANFNPAMHMHAFPFEGPGERLSTIVLDLLFPELKK